MCFAVRRHPCEKAGQCCQGCGSGGAQGGLSHCPFASTTAASQPPAAMNRCFCTLSNCLLHTTGQVHPTLPVLCSMQPLSGDGYAHSLFSTRILNLEAAPHATPGVMQERAAWEGVAEELLRRDPVAAARYEKLAEAERRVSELMVHTFLRSLGSAQPAQRDCRCPQRRCSECEHIASASRTASQQVAPCVSESISFIDAERI